MLYFLHRHSEWRLLKLCFYANLGFLKMYISIELFSRVLACLFQIVFAC